MELDVRLFLFDAAEPTSKTRFKEIRSESAASNDLNNLQPVAGLELALVEVRRTERLLVEFNYDASGQQPLLHQELVDRTGKRD